MLGRDQCRRSLYVSREYLVYFCCILVDSGRCFTGEFFSDLRPCCSTKKVSQQTLQCLYFEPRNCRFSHCHIFDHQVSFFMTVVLV